MAALVLEVRARPGLMLTAACTCVLALIVTWAHAECKPQLVVNISSFLSCPSYTSLSPLLPSPLQARGIDVQQVSLVINYDLPANRENYIHR